MNASYSAASSYRTEAVGLRPQGNTVTVDVPSDNPFEDELSGAPVTVVTQASGGMAKADRKQKSIKIMPHGRKPGIPVRQAKRVLSAKRMGGFMPGMGEIDGDDESYRRFLLQKAGLQGWLDNAMRGPVRGLNTYTRTVKTFVRRPTIGNALNVIPHVAVAQAAMDEFGLKKPLSRVLNKVNPFRGGHGSRNAGAAAGGAMLIDPGTATATAAGAAPMAATMGDLDDDDVEVGLYGAVRKPDPRRMAKGRPAKAKVYAVSARPQAKRMGGFMPGMGEEVDFMPGMGDLDGALEDSAYRAFNTYDADAKSMNRGQYDANPSKRGYWEQYVRDQDARADAVSSAKTKNWLDTITSSATQAAGIVKADKDARATAAQANAARAVAEAQARATNATSDADRARANADLRRAELNKDSVDRAADAAAKSGSTKWLVGGGVAVVALGVLAFILLSKKKAAPAA
jgi:hypothetical protein